VKTGKIIRRGLLGVACVMAVLPAFGAQLGGDAQSAIPKDIQQLIVIDYRAMQNSPAAMQLRSRVMPPELKQLESALKTSGLNENRDVDQLAFASFRVNAEATRTLGVAQGQFSIQDILGSFRKQKLKPTLVRTNKIYPMGESGLLVSFLNPTTMVFGASDAVKMALDARDGISQSLLNNQPILDMMKTVEQEPLWSVLDQKGTQIMMHSVLGDAAQLADYETVKKRLLNSSYTMNFQNGVKFNLYVATPDTFTAATMSSLLNAAMLYKKMSGSTTEKQAIDETNVDSDSGKLVVKFAASDTQFASLLQSPLFQTVVH
jgi:hypothetical protein